MFRFVVSAIVVVAVVIGILFLLAGRATERAQTRVEKPVSLANLAG